jgi:hypothetical protein
MSSYSTTHDGLERVLEGTRVLTHAVGPTRSLRTVPLIVLTGIVTAVVAVASRQFADAMPDGFTGEWLATWGLEAHPVRPWRPLHPGACPCRPRTPGSCR